MLELWFTLTSPSNGDISNICKADMNDQDILELEITETCVIIYDTMLHPIVCLPITDNTHSTLTRAELMLLRIIQRALPRGYHSRILELVVIPQPFAT